MRGKGLMTTTYLAIITLVFLLTSSLAEGRVFEFQKTKGTKVEVLSYYDFLTRLGSNPEIPKTNEEVIALAQKLYPPLEKRRPAEPGEEVVIKECGEHEFGLLFAALQNPDISDATRSQVDAIIADSVPPLPQTYTSGHFKFYYTDSDPNPDHNVTLEEIKVTARYLNSYWRRYERNFKTPMHYVLGSEQLIDVRVYFDPEYEGATLPSWDYIFLNSIWCVKDACKRKTTPAHELFHRVQFSYGLSGDPVSGIMWIAEGTAAWSQKYTNRLIRDYMKWMNRGLHNDETYDAPDRDLIFKRSLDACHLWVYLEEQSEPQGWTAIRDVWANYEVNGHDAKAAVNTVALGRLGVGFEGFVQLWLKTNYIKDLVNAGRTYDYDEDEISRTSCGQKYGPLDPVDVPSEAKVSINSSTTWSKSAEVRAYGADYYEFNLDLTRRYLEIRVKATGTPPGDFSWHFIGIKDDKWVSITDDTSADYTYTRTLASGEWDKVALVVGGREKGGSYTVSVGCGGITGTWNDNYGQLWTFTQSGTSISGTMVQTAILPSGYCGTLNVTGTYVEPSITLTAVNPSPPVGCCCDIICSGAVSGCTASGTMSSTNLGCGTTCLFNDPWFMTKIPPP